MEYLVAVDGSEESKDAVAWAASLAGDSQGEITAIHVAVPAVFDDRGDEPTSVVEADNRLIREGLEHAERRGRTVLEEASAIASERGMKMDTELYYGDPVSAITAYADTEDVDMIVVGHRGRTERAEMMLGSVAKRLVERADVPVTVVRGVSRRTRMKPTTSTTV